MKPATIVKTVKQFYVYFIKIKFQDKEIFTRCSVRECFPEKKQAKIRINIDNDNENEFIVNYDELYTYK
jgi:hypothetical protein